MNATPNDSAASPVKKPAEAPAESPSRSSLRQVADLDTLFFRACAGGDAAAAREAGEALLLALDEAKRETLYSLLRTHVRRASRDEAYSWLERTLAADWWDFARIQKDEELGDFRQEERFRSSLREAWSRQYIAMLDRPERESFQKPDEVMAALALRPGEKVAEVGGGSGYFTVRLSRAVGPQGRVFTTDIRQEMLNHIAGRLDREGIQNVELKRATPDDPDLPAAWADTIFVADTIHYVRPLDQFARRLTPGLRPDGRVVIIEYTPKTMEERSWGPPPEQQVSREELDAAMAAAGLLPSRVHGFLTEQYFVEYAAVT
jgi:ubiquinone/menaquinone biosynthesis C-methylase UbiE